MTQLYIVEVDDHCNPQMTGHTGCSYTSPPQPELQALALVRALLNCTQGPITIADAPWTGAIAGGRRIIRLHPAQADGQLNHLTRLSRGAGRGHGAAGAAPSGGCHPSAPRSPRS